MGKMYNICKVKTHISTVLTVKSCLDPHMINELEDGSNRKLYLWFWTCFCNICSASFNVSWYKLLP
jgi:hypothetical protein